MTDKLAGNSILDLHAIAEEAERAFIVDGMTELVVPVRRRPGIDRFYEKLEQELQVQELATVVDFRMVKEGYVRISRPSALKIDRDVLFNQRPYLRSLQREISDWRRLFGEALVTALLRIAYADCVRDVAMTRACFEIFEYLGNNRTFVQGLMSRQIPHSNSTKLIGRESLLLKIFSLWRNEPATWMDFYRYFGIATRAVDFRFYAPRCSFDGHRLNELHGLLSTDWSARYEFSALSGTLIVENLETFYSESARSTDRLIVWGAGWRAAALRDVHEMMPRPILYWGDMDKEGYEIYGFLKGFIGDLSSTLMDRATLSRYRNLSAAKEPFFGPFRSAAELQAEYQDACQNGLCIEQEKIHERPY
jgi:hypothetical protein